MTRENTTLDDISTVIGLSATVTLSVWFGGLGNLYVPRIAAEGQTLVKLIGLSAAKRMTTEWGGAHIAIPRLSSYEDESLRHLIGRMLENGFGSAEVARHTRLSQRRVQQICRELEQSGLIKITAPVQRASVLTDDGATGQEPHDSASLTLQRALGIRLPTANFDEEPTGADLDETAPNCTTND